MNAVPPPPALGGSGRLLATGHHLHGHGNPNLPQQQPVNNSTNQRERSLRSIFVGNIPYEATEEQLIEIFREVGHVVSFRLVHDKDTKRPKGYGFCEYQDTETAASAVRNLASRELHGRTLRVDSSANAKMQQKSEEDPAAGAALAERPMATQVAAVDPKDAPKAIAQAVDKLSARHIFNMLKDLKDAIKNYPEETHQLLASNPHVAYASLLAPVAMGLVEPDAAEVLLHPTRPPVAILEPAPLAPATPQQVVSSQQQQVSTTPHREQPVPPPIPLIGHPPPTGGQPPPTFPPPAAVQPHSHNGQHHPAGAQPHPAVTQPMPAPPHMSQPYPAQPHTGQPQSVPGQQQPFPNMQQHNGQHMATQPHAVQPQPPQPFSTQQQQQQQHPGQPHTAYPPPMQTSPGAMTRERESRGPVYGSVSASRATPSTSSTDSGPINRNDFTDAGFGPRGPRGASKSTPSDAGQSHRPHASATGQPQQQQQPAINVASTALSNLQRTLSGGAMPGTDEEKAKLIMQVLNLSEQELLMLSPEQRDSVRLLKQQLSSAIK